MEAIVPPGQNTSWSIQFPGPALHCGNMSDDLITAVQDNIVKAFTQQPNDTRCSASGFVAWVGSNDGTSKNLPFIKAGNNSWTSRSASMDYNKTFTSQGYDIRGAEFLYMVTISEAMSTLRYTDHSILYLCADPGNTKLIREMLFGKDSDSLNTFTQCHVVNATYHASFNYVDGARDLQIKSIPTSQKPLTPVGWVYGPAANPPAGSQFASPDCNPLNQIGSIQGYGNRFDFFR